MPECCLVREALMRAKKELEWLGLAGSEPRLRNFAAARLRYTSLCRPDESSLLLKLAHDIENWQAGACPHCGEDAIASHAPTA